MNIFNISIPDRALTKILGVFMRYTFNIECGIVNLNTSELSGSHWVCYYRNGIDIIYIESYGQITPVETVSKDRY